MLSALLCFFGCGEFLFKRNPDLELIRQADTGTLSPAWSPDGTTLYFVLVSSGTRSGELRAMRSDGSGERLLFGGDCFCVSPSPDGTKLAVVASLEGSYVAGTLLMLDTSGAVIDTFSSVGSRVTGVCFGSSNDRLYYSVSFEGVFRLDMRSMTVDTILLASLGSRRNFDVSGDSLLCSPEGVLHLATGRKDSLPAIYQPRFCPTDPSVLLSESPPDNFGFHADLMLVDRKTGSQLRLDANPYYACDIVDPCWSPDAKHIALSATKMYPGGWVDDPPHATSYSLWSLTRR